MNLSSLYSYNGMTLELVVWSMFIGIVIAGFAIFFLKRVVGSFMRGLLEAGAASPETAKSMRELGMAGNFVVLRSLRGKSTLRRMLRTADPSDETLSDRRRLPDVRFYIPRECAYRAERLYDSKGATLVNALLSILAFLIMAVLSFTVIPDLIQMLENLIGSF